MYRLAILSVVIISVLQGCGGGTASTPTEYQPVEDEVSTKPVNKFGETDSSATVGSGGGRLVLGDGVVLEIPRGAIQEPTEVVLKQLPSNAAFKRDENEKLVGPMFVISPEMLATIGKFTVSFPINGFPEGYDEKNLYLATEELGTEQRSFGENTTVTRWDYKKAQYRGGRAVAELDSVAGMRMQFILSR